MFYLQNEIHQIKFMTWLNFFFHIIDYFDSYVCDKFNYNLFKLILSLNVLLLFFRIFFKYLFYRFIDKWNNIN